MRKTWMIAAAALMSASGASAADLTLKRVLLSTGGVGLYEYEAQIEGDASVELTVRRDQVDDVLKSLTVFDDHGGVGGLDLASPEPLAESFRTLPFTAADLQSTPKLLAALRGAEVEVGAPRALKGRIVAIADETQPNGAAALHRVTLMSDQGLESFVLEQAESVRFADAALREAIGKGLAAVAASSERDSRTLRLSAKGEGKRTLRVAYLAAAPVWKVSYRLVLDPLAEAKRGALQGWATLENLSGQDWKEVDLTLVSGRPVSYKQALYRAYMIDRPEAPVDIGAALTPGVDRGALQAAPLAAMAPAPPADGLPRRHALMRAAKLAVAPESVAPGVAAGAAAVAASQGETQVSFHLPAPVSVANGRTLSLPIVDADEPVERIALYDRDVDASHPLSAAELTNDTAAALPPGIVTIYENAAGGASYVGDSQLSATPAGEKRLMAFALDQKTTVAEEDNDDSQIARARLVKGVLTIEDLTRRRIVYRVNAIEPRKLVVYAPKLEGSTLTEPSSDGVSEADGRYRAPFAVAAGDNSFAVTQERRDTRLIALAELDVENLATFAKAGAVDADSRASLEKLVELRGKQSDAQREVDEAQADIDKVTADQTRLKDLVGAAPAGSDLAKRYLKKLDADETELESLGAARTAREKARDAAAEAVEAFVAGL